MLLTPCLFSLYPRFMQEFGKALIFLGVVVVIVGAVLYFSGRANLPIGRLPGERGRIAGGGAPAVQREIVPLRERG